MSSVTVAQACAEVLSAYDEAGVGEMWHAASLLPAELRGSEDVRGLLAALEAEDLGRHDWRDGNE